MEAQVQRVLIWSGPLMVLPRWLAHLTAWAAILITPAGLVLFFFKDGPFAWNGVVGIYIPLVAFALWMGAISYEVHKALSRQGEDGTNPA